MQNSIAHIFLIAALAAFGKFLNILPDFSEKSYALIGLHSSSTSDPFPFAFLVNNNGQNVSSAKLVPRIILTRHKLFSCVCNHCLVREYNGMELGWTLVTQDETTICNVSIGINYVCWPNHVQHMLKVHQLRKLNRMIVF